MVIDENYNILEMNPSARRMLDLEMVNPTGMPLISVLPKLTYSIFPPRFDV